MPIARERSAGVGVGLYRAQQGGAAPALSALLGRLLAASNACQP
jgi:hypothetical protein